MDCIINFLKFGDFLYELFKKEKDNVLVFLKKKVGMVISFFNSIEGIKCNEV